MFSIGYILTLLALVLLAVGFIVLMSLSARFSKLQKLVQRSAEDYDSDAHEEKAD